MAIRFCTEPPTAEFSTYRKADCYFAEGPAGRQEYW